MHTLKSETTSKVAINTIAIRHRNSKPNSEHAARNFRSKFDEYDFIILVKFGDQLVDMMTTWIAFNVTTLDAANFRPTTS